MPVPSDYDAIEKLLDGRSIPPHLRQKKNIRSIDLEDLDPSAEKILANELRLRLKVIRAKELIDPGKDYAFWNKGMTLLMYAAFHGAKFAIIPLLEFCNDYCFKMHELRLELDEEFKESYMGFKGNLEGPKYKKLSDVSAIRIAREQGHFIFLSTLVFITYPFIYKDQDYQITVDEFLASMLIPSTAPLYDNYKSIIKQSLLNLDVSKIAKPLVQQPLKTFEDLTYEYSVQINDILLTNILKELYKPKAVIAKQGFDLQIQVIEKLHSLSIFHLTLILECLNDEEKPHRVTKKDFLSIVRIFGKEQQIKWFVDKVSKSPKEEKSSVSFDHPLLIKFLTYLHASDTIKIESGILLQKQIINKLKSVPIFKLEIMLANLSCDDKTLHPSKNEFWHMVRIFGTQEQIEWAIKIKAKWANAVLVKSAPLTTWPQKQCKTERVIEFHRETKVSPH